MQKIAIYLVLLFLVSCQTEKASVVTTATEKTKDTLIVRDLPKVKHPVEYSLDFMIGQMILVGLNDRTEFAADDELLMEIKNEKLGGVILFEKNISKEGDAKLKLQKLIADMQGKVKVPLFISIDEEGGKVHRLKSKYGFIETYSAEELGRLNNLDSTFYYTSQLAALLSDLGINVNFAPDVDVAVNPNNPVIAKVGRSYSSDPIEVANHGIACIKAHHANNVKTSIKHFPGHGSSLTDSHLGITDVTKYWDEKELIPFRKIINSGHCDAVMTAHIVNRNLDSTSLPATLSKVVVTDLLRKTMGFKGVVFSDDMQMYAISKNYGLENAIKQSILAGVDVLVFGNNVNLNDRITATEIHAILSKMVSSGEVKEERITQSFNRIMALKNKKVK